MERFHRRETTIVVLLWLLFMKPKRSNKTTITGKSKKATLQDFWCRIHIQRSTTIRGHWTHLHLYLGYYCAGPPKRLKLLRTQETIHQTYLPYNPSYRASDDNIAAAKQRRGSLLITKYSCVPSEYELSPNVYVNVMGTVQLKVHGGHPARRTSGRLDLKK